MEKSERLHGIGHNIEFGFYGQSVVFFRYENGEGIAIAHEIHHKAIFELAAGSFWRVILKKKGTSNLFKNFQNFYFMLHI